MGISTLKKKKGTAEAYQDFLGFDEKEKSFTMDDFSGGVCVREIAIGKNTVASLRNMQVEGKALFSISAPRTVDYSFCSGEVTDGALADGIWLFRKGRTLYGMKEGVFHMIGLEGMMEAERGAIFHAGDCFYVIDGTRILRVETSLAYAVLEQEPTLWYVGVSADGKTYTPNEKPNPFCRYLEYEVTASYGNAYTVPSHLAVDASFAEVYSMAGVKYGASSFSFDGEKITVKNYDEAGYRIRLKLLNTSTNVSKTSFATLAEDRALFAMAEDIAEMSLPSHAHVYLYRDGTTQRRVIALLTDGFWDFSKLSRDKIMVHDHVERIGALVPYAEGYLVFSEGAVKKLSFTENTQTRQFHFETAAFKHDFGSDMPKSICIFDDKIIFANSRSGVYYINKFGISERDASRRISANIETSFFSHTDAEYADAAAVCAFGKYYLTIGDLTYVWDYSAELPDSTQSIEEEYQMRWTIADVLFPSRYLCEVGKRLYFEERETNRLCYLAQTHSDGEAIYPSLETISSDLGEDGVKRLTSIAVRYRAAEEVTLVIIYDGEPSPITYRLPMSECFSTVTIHPHGRRFTQCAVLISSARSMAVEKFIFHYL